MTRTVSARNRHPLARPRGLLQIKGTPIASVMLGSLLSGLLPLVAQAPVLPPFGLMLFIAWRMIRPDIWPLWIGLPLGLFDDVMTGQPIGSAVFLWSIVLIGLEFESRGQWWYDYKRDWIVAAIAIIFAIAGGWVIVRLAGQGGSMVQLTPQMAYSVGLFPLVVRFCARLDSWRLP